MKKHVEIRTCLRMERSLHDCVAVAAKRNERNFSEEVRHRLAASFSEGEMDAPETAREDYGEDAGALEVAQAIGRFIDDPPDSDFQRAYLKELWEIFWEKLNAIITCLR